MYTFPISFETKTTASTSVALAWYKKRYIVQNFCLLLRIFLASPLKEGTYYP